MIWILFTNFKDHFKITYEIGLDCRANTMQIIHHINYAGPNLFRFSRACTCVFINKRWINFAQRCRISNFTSWLPQFGICYATSKTINFPQRCRPLTISIQKIASQWLPHFPRYFFTQNWSQPIVEPKKIDETTKIIGCSLILSLERHLNQFPATRTANWAALGVLMHTHTAMWYLIFGYKMWHDLFILIYSWRFAWWGNQAWHWRGWSMLNIHCFGAFPVWAYKGIRPFGTCNHSHSHSHSGSGSHWLWLR